MEREGQGMRTFNHVNVRSVEEAVATLWAYKDKTRINAGGTDLLGVLKDEILPDYPEWVVNIKTIAGLEYIREEEGFLKIGALTKLCDLAGSPLLNGRYGVLAEAARAVASPQIRNVATIGGNLCQDIRCWYYRYPRHTGGPIWCARKGKGPCHAIRGDNRYHAILGGKKCFAVCPSDTAVALAALDAQVVIAGADGERKMAVTAFYHPFGNGLNVGEMIREVEIPILKGYTFQRFLKFTLRRPIDFAIVSVATMVAMTDGICRDARIVLGAVAPGPVRAKGAEEVVLGKTIDEPVAGRAADAALASSRPLSKNGYKIEIARTLVRRAIQNLDL
jgi:xanthine dehydrogenase YagS FAD-binding subunit